MRKFENLSDGESDGFIVFYLKDKKICAVVLNEEQAQGLDLSLKLAFGKDKARICPIDENIMIKMIKGERV